nr:hypothetical protein [Tanacetum cinerariifolium]
MIITLHSCFLLGFLPCVSPRGFGQLGKGQRHMGRSGRGLGYCSGKVDAQEIAWGCGYCFGGNSCWVTVGLVIRFRVLS